MRRILVTGFEPFAGAARNPAGEIATALDDARLRDFEIRSVVLPVARAAAGTQLADAIAEIDPGAVVSLGLAGERAVVSVEQVAVNVEDFAIPDESGAQPHGEPVIKGGPDALLATLPVHTLVAAIREAGVPAEVSRSAGTFLCNRVFYLSLYGGRTLGRPRAVFIHLPPLPEMVAAHGADGPSMSLDTSTRAVRAALEAVALRLASSPNP